VYDLLGIIWLCVDLTQLEGVLEKERKRENVTETIRTHIYSMQDALSSALQVEVEAQMLRVISG